MAAYIESNEVTEEKKQFIAVKLSSEIYGIDIGYVDTIVRMQKITRVPKAQSYFKGVINLRGEIVPRRYTGKNVWNGFQEVGL